MRFAERSKFVQQIVTRADGRTDGRIDEGEILDLAELEGLHAQDDLGEVRTLNLRHGEAVALFKIFLRIQTDADAVLHTACTAGTLVGAALGDSLDGQALGARAWIVTADASEAGVHHVTYAWNGDGGFGDVCGDDDAALTARLEDALLLGGGHAAKQCEHFEARTETAIKKIARLADVALRGHEDEHVAVVGFDEGVFHGGDGTVDEPKIVFAAFKRRVANIHGKHASGDFDDGRATERSGEGLGVDGGGGDEQLEVGPLFEEAYEVAEEEVNVQGAFVRFIENEHGIVPQHGIALDLSQQNAVRHELDAGVAAGVVAEAHLAADFPAPRHV